MKKGMDPETVEALATQFEQLGDELYNQSTQLSGLVEGIDWQGSDREKFVAEFNQLTKNSALQIAQRLKQLATKARQNAHEQRQASAS